ncbi:MAG: type II toxin-antitoxin system VapC family toxin [Rhizobiaceae bacterium]
MVDISRLYVDTNVLISLGEGTDQISRAILDLVGTIMPGEEFLFASELSLAELLVVPQRMMNDDLISLYDNWIQPEGWLIIGPVNRQVLWCAAIIRARYPSIKLPNAIHLSTGIGFGCSHFLTGDRRLPSEIVISQTRFGQTSGSARVEILILNLENLSAMTAKRQS